jgi:thiol:disulfide interchange protein DsbA
MNRRELARLLGGLAWIGAGGQFAAAQDAPIEIQDYVRLDKPLELSLPPRKKIEVVEFFWFECPHCNAFEPLLAEWIRALPADVAFRYVPVGFSPRHVPGQRLFYALESMGLEDSLHARIYDAIHRRHRGIDFEWQMASLVSALGADGAAFRERVRTSEVMAQARVATQLADAYDVDGVPTLGIHGRFRTSPAMTGSRERTLKVADYLIERCRESA